MFYVLWPHASRVLSLLPTFCALLSMALLLMLKTTAIGTGSLRQKQHIRCSLVQG